MTCGIYAIVCTKTWRSYVGQSVNIERRTKDHFQRLRISAHTNPSLNSDFEKYGEDSFYIEVLEIVTDKSLLINREKYWSAFGYNLYGGESGYLSIPKLTEKQINYFWSNVDIREENDCWEYKGSITESGYGRVKFEQKQCLAHRISFYLTNEEETSNVVICHRCNNKACVNPKHLYAGTIQDNNKDMYRSGSKGVLNWDWVGLIRDKFAENPSIPGRELHNWFSSNIADIQFDRDYLIDVAMNIKWTDENYTPPTRMMRKLNFELAEEIRELSKNGMSYGKIVKLFLSKYNISINPSTISNIITNKLYRRN